MNDGIAARIARRFGPAREIVPLAPDASTRLFYRLIRDDGPNRVALVDLDGGEAAFLRLLAAHERLASIGVPVPALVDRDPEIPALLFEDLGGELLADALAGADSREESRLYREAARIAATIARDGTLSLDRSGPLASAPLGRERMRAELSFFEREDLVGRRGIVDEPLLADLGAALDRLAARCAARAPVLAHRDFHARNLMLTPDGRLGVLDFQDALLAPDVYDLASLVFDPYVSLRDGTAETATEEFAHVARFGVESVRSGLAAVGLQRLLKALGTFAHQVAVRGNERFEASVAPAESRTLRLAAVYDRQTGETLTRALRAARFEGGD